MSAHLPVLASFPFDDNAKNWFFRAGSDDGPNGKLNPARPPGPIEATILPGTPFATTGWAFVMVEGNGLANLLNRGGQFGGFTVAVGAGLSKTFGVKGVLWADVKASIAAAMTVVASISLPAFTPVSKCWLWLQ